MDLHIGKSDHLPPAAESGAQVEPAAPDTARKPAPTAAYVLVEDLEYLWRTGKSRQILVLRWTR